MEQLLLAKRKNPQILANICKPLVGFLFGYLCIEALSHQRTTFSERGLSDLFIRLATLFGKVESAASSRERAEPRLVTRCRTAHKRPASALPRTQQLLAAAKC